MKILILDDFLDQVKDTVEYLESEEYTVFLASNAAEVYKQFEEDQPDICFFDVMLETETHLNGIDIARKILSKYKVPIVIYTQASFESHFYEQAKNLGVIFEDKNKIKNFSWLENILSDVISQNKPIQDKLKSFFLTETIRENVYEETGSKTLFHHVTSSDIMALSSYSNGQSYTYVWIDKSRINEKTPINYTVSIGKVYNYLAKITDVGHLTKVANSLYIDLSRIKKIDRGRIIMDTGIEISNIPASAIKGIEKQINAIKVSMMNNG